MSLISLAQIVEDCVIRSLPGHSAAHHRSRPALTAAITVPIAFTLSYLMRFVFPHKAQFILQLVLVSLFSGYLVRIYAWRTILGKQGLNSALQWLGAIDRPLEYLHLQQFRGDKWSH